MFLFVQSKRKNQRPVRQSNKGQACASPSINDALPKNQHQHFSAGQEWPTFLADGPGQKKLSRYSRPRDIPLQILTAL
jgi:hypothetical protein